MATSPTPSLEGKILKLSVEAQRNVINFSRGVLTAHQATIGDLQNKMDAIDIAYARFIETSKSGNTNGVDDVADVTPCDIFATDDNVIPPIVVSQVDSYVAYLADVFLSGTPLFPVVSSPSKRIWAEQLETLLDDHASLGGYVRQLLLFLRDGAKYNYCAVEAEWDSIDQFSVLGDFTNETGRKIDRKAKFFTKLRRLNPRNVIRDPNVLPGDVSEHGDYAGHLEILSKTRLKRYLNKLSMQGKAYNVDKALASTTTVVTPNTAHYRYDPQVSDYVTSRRLGSHGVNWDQWFEPEQKSAKRSGNYGSTYEKFVLYARIMPSEFGITAPQKNTPQIWKFVIINQEHLVSAERIISAYDYLPILIGQPLEDGLGDQTKSIAEGEIPFQKAASTLFNIRFAAARRSVSDRALYLPDMIDPDDVNNAAAAPKIPVRISSLSNKTLGDAYQQIPFDMRGTETTIQDAATIVGFSKELHGLNAPRQGQFQKGNKSVTEWNDVMAGSDNRLRLPALTLEYQIFSPLKSILTLNIFQYGEDVHVISQKTGEELTIQIDQLRKQVLAFKLADGYTPRSKTASTDMIVQGMNMISQSPLLQQAYGAMLPQMFAHLMSLGGVKGLEEYSAPATQGTLPGAAGANTLQEPPAVSAGGQVTTP